MKKLAKILTLALAASLMLCAAAGCGDNKPAETASTPESSAAGAADEIPSDDDGIIDESTADESTADASVDPKTADYTNPAVTINFGDTELIQTVTQDMQSGKYDGKVIKVTGISQKRMSSCTIMEKDETTGTGYGMTYYIDGQPDLSEYPADDAKIEILGVVTIGEYDVRALTVLPENVKVLEDSAAE